MYINDNNKNNRIVFLTGTRADYGKMKSLIKAVEASNEFVPYIFATGMHMLSIYGTTHIEIVKNEFKNIYPFVNQNDNTNMDITLSNTITGFSNYINQINPAAIVVHGDRLEALAGAIVGALNNIKVFHIEGGEISGTIDESIRHAISKFSHYHLVSNEEAKKRVLQMGEPEENIFIIGSPDIDIMYSDSLPSLDNVKSHYEIDFNSYSIFMYHPVTTELPLLEKHIHTVIKSLIESQENFVAIYPNNDAGSRIILKELSLIKDHPRFRIFPSMRFESFLTLLKNADCIVGNSSSGIREAGIYGIPAIDIGTRQYGRYIESANSNIVHVKEDITEVFAALFKAKSLHPKPLSYYGSGNSNILFMDILRQRKIWNADIQKKFIDIDF
mgnify:CR=1 FL=1